MKTTFERRALNSVILIFLCFSVACKKETTPAPVNPVVQTGVLYMHIHTKINQTEVDSGAIATDESGRKFELDTAQFYISNIKLKKPDGTFVSANGVYLLKTIAQEAYLVGNVAAGNYLSVSFDVGIDAATNQTNPSSYSATSSLSVQNPSMWFGSTSEGYMFVNVIGKADTSAGNSGNVDSRFSYQLGTNNMLKTVTLPDKSFTLYPGATPNYIHLYADYGKLLQGVNFKTQNIATPWVNATVASQISTNIPSMFGYEE